jgi:radical SAM superfamily enzyme YgiQ (UPF0313 family)
MERVPRELDQLHAAGWQDGIFIVDDNFIGDKPRATVFLAAITR